MATSRPRTTASPIEEGQSNGRLNNGDVRKLGAQKEEKTTSDSSTSTTTLAAATVLSPALFTTFVLIFGGCCSNVYTLESILSLSPATGSLVTFLQFLLTSLFTLPTQLTSKTPSNSSPNASFGILPRLRALKVPFHKWLLYTMMFLAVNILNNSAFNYRISIPLHIILRSAGPVTSMLVGYFVAGRRYEPRKVVAVMLLFSGVVLAALSDASSKGKVAITDVAASSELSKQLPGFALLFLALLISALMGIYADGLFNTYGRTAEVANESLFYSHVLALPYFAAQYESLYGQYLVMLANVSVQSTTSSVFAKKSWIQSVLQPLIPYLPLKQLVDINFSAVPILLLLANALTQIVCITGVHRLSTQTTSLTVSIVLNIRKLVSLILSIWLFGNTLPLGVTIGAAIVFLGGGLYGLPSRSSKGKPGKGDRATVQKKDR